MINALSTNDLKETRLLLGRRPPHYPSNSPLRHWHTHATAEVRHVQFGQEWDPGNDAQCELRWKLLFYLEFHTVCIQDYHPNQIIDSEYEVEYEDEDGTRSSFRTTKTVKVCVSKASKGRNVFTNSILIPWSHEND